MARNTHSILNNKRGRKLAPVSIIALLIDTHSFPVKAMKYEFRIDILTVVIVASIFEILSSVIGATSPLTEEEKNLVGNYKRAAEQHRQNNAKKTLEYERLAQSILDKSPETIVETTPLSQGLFKFLPHDVKRLFAVKYFLALGIKDLVNLEKTSLGMGIFVQEIPSYRIMKQEVTWKDVKRLQVPHQENCSWLQAFVARSALVEASIANYESQVLGHISTVDYYHPQGLSEDILELNWELRSRFLNEEACTLGDRNAIHRKIDGMTDGYYCYAKDLKTAGLLNEELVKQRDKRAIYRKMNGLDNGTYGYAKDPEAAKALNESLVNQRDKEAIQRKMKGLYNGCYGYEKDPVAARLFNEDLVKKRDKEALHRKQIGLTYGSYGYEKNPANAIILNEDLIKEGDKEALRKKVYGLAYGLYSYEKDIAAARTLNDYFVNKGDKEANHGKIRGLEDGGYGYDKNNALARDLNDILVSQGDLWAIQRKVIGLQQGLYSYEKNHTAAYDLVRRWLIIDF